MKIVKAMLIFAVAVFANSGGVTTKTDMDVEVDAFEQQFKLEKILGVEATFIRDFFDDIDAQEKLSPAIKRFHKAALLYGKNRKGGYKMTGAYHLRTRDEYQMEAGK